jgi:hypothetical protein
LCNARKVGKPVYKERPRHLVRTADPTMLVLAGFGLIYYAPAIVLSRYLYTCTTRARSNQTIATCVTS